MGSPVSRTQIEFSDEEIGKIAETFNAWANGGYEDIDGFCVSVSREQIASNRDSLFPGRYIANETEDKDEDEEFEFLERTQILAANLELQFSTSLTLQSSISEKLKQLGIGE